MIDIRADKYRRIKKFFFLSIFQFQHTVNTGSEREPYLSVNLFLLPLFDAGPEPVKYVKNKTGSGFKICIILQAQTGIKEKQEGQEKREEKTRRRRAGED